MVKVYYRFKRALYKYKVKITFFPGDNHTTKEFWATVYAPNKEAAAVRTMALLMEEVKEVKIHIYAVSSQVIHANKMGRL